MSLASLFCVIACNPNNTVQLTKCYNLFLLSFETSSCSVVSIGKYFSCLVWAIINCRQHQKVLSFACIYKKDGYANNAMFNERDKNISLN